MEVFPACLKTRKQVVNISTKQHFIRLELIVLIDEFSIESKHWISYELT